MNTTRSLRSIYRRVYQGVNYRLRTFAGGRWAHLCRPTSIALLLTERCNARCVHCDIWKNCGAEDSPSVDQWKTFLSDIRRWLGPVHLFLTGGEALLKPFTIDLVAHGSSIGLFVEVLTHGYWSDQSKIEALALARPWRVTVSLDGFGKTHDEIRGRNRFFDKTTGTIRTLQRIRKERLLDFTIRLKTVVMAHNLDNVCQIAQYANQDGMDVFYQPIEQNYNTPEDPAWFERSDTWPRDTSTACAAVERLIDLKRQGFPIANSYPQLQAMIPYFQQPALNRIAVQSHAAHEQTHLCSALTMLQIQANGSVTVCSHKDPVGNIKATPIRTIWQERPRWWNNGCCLERRAIASRQTESV